MFLAVPMATTMFSEVDVLLLLYLTIPATTVTAERSFSALCRVKTYLRSTMTEKRLNSILLLHTHHDFCVELDLRQVATVFVFS